MRHRIYGKQLNRTSAHRKALMRNLAAGLFEHGQIETTMPKAKLVQGYAEKLITLAKDKSLHTRRQLERKINDRNIFAWADDPQVPDDRKAEAFFEVPEEGAIKRNRYGDLKKSPRLVEHLIAKVAPMFEGRDGGYTRIVKLDKHRLGDGTDLVLLQLVGREDGPQVGGGTSSRRKQADRRSAFAAKLAESFGGGAAVAEEEPPAETEEAPAEEAPVEETATEDAAPEEEKTDDA
ncbi:MAG: 50S ribosomal protein L17 [Planctomycetota bacterium]|nr:50S ribosomal protein L17 [Planctomycetota bacterium]